jgi:signal recognition particle receptor subunit beta
VIDSNDAERFEEAAEELHYAMNSDEMPRNAVILLLANKQDLPQAKSLTEITQAMKLPQLKNEWFIQSACAVNGEGLIEGFEWLANKINSR